MPELTPTPDDVTLVDLHYAALFRFALSLARREADACDLVQHTFLIWATKGHTLRDPTKAKTWLFTTLFREYLRTHSREARVEALEDQPEDRREPVTDAAPSFEAPFHGCDVLKALGELEETYRAPLSLFYLQAMPYSKIASLLDVPIGTVMSRLSRGKARLRALLLRGLPAADQAALPFPPQRRKSS